MARWLATSGVPGLSGGGRTNIIVDACPLVEYSKARRAQSYGHAGLVANCMDGCANHFALRAVLEDLKWKLYRWTQEQYLQGQEQHLNIAVYCRRGQVGLSSLLCCSGQALAGELHTLHTGRPIGRCQSSKWVAAWEVYPPVSTLPFSRPPPLTYSLCLCSTSWPPTHASSQRTFFIFSRV